MFSKIYELLGSLHTFIVTDYEDYYTWMPLAAQDPIPRWSSENWSSILYVPVNFSLPTSLASASATDLFQFSKPLREESKHKYV